ncbi:MAG: NupC/NupG family nucleoside CNT transporter [Bacteroidales bacterium]|jgi:CNT family concentrative nucleoside transporter
MKIKNKKLKNIAIILLVFSGILVITGAISLTFNPLYSQNEDNSVLSQGSDISIPNDTLKASDTLYISADTTSNTLVEDKTNELADVVSNLNNSMGKISLSNILRAVLGIIVILFICWLLSTNRRAIKWKYVILALLLQIILALCIIYIPFVAKIFEFFGKIFIYISLSAEQGTVFLFGKLVNFEQIGYMFAFKILPTIIFFSALTSLLFYWGVIQVIVRFLGFIFTKFLGLSGVESLSLAGNIFLGQTEAPLVVKAYLDKITDSELFLVMVGGMATMAGGVLAAYITMLGGNDFNAQVLFAKHLLAASVMAAPAAVVTARILVPQTETINYNIKVSRNKKDTNTLNVISEGAIEGMKLAANIAAMLLVFIALIALTNYILGFIGRWTNLNTWIVNHTSYNSFSLEFLLGYALSPLMWLLGVPSSDIMYLGQLLGEKTILNEFVGYSSLKTMIINNMLQPKSIIMGVYLLCGFANFGSIGIQIGGIGQLAPNKRKLLAKFGVRALMAAAITALLSATIMGALLG